MDRRRIAAGFLSLVVAVGGHALVQRQALAQSARSETPLAALRQDARLNDVWFVDALHGWAVGEQGAIWRTTDGGQRWQLQESGVACALQSVHFLDRLRGVVAGGTLTPLSPQTTAVLLFTQDGGRTWKQQETPLPALRRVRFFSADQGWAIGARSPLFPSGVFITDNGGRSWTALHGHSQGWMAGEFTDATTGVLASRTGELAFIRRQGVEPSQTPPPGLRRLHDLRMQTPMVGWLAGDGGLLMRTSDGGVSWQLPSTSLPGSLEEHMDWHAVEVHGAHCWAAGVPGTRLVHSPDGGQTWQALATGQHAPLYALRFVDEQTGWAVGAWGTILATNDGGQTWTKQRSGGSRAALWGVYGEAGEVPLEYLVKAAGNDGYLTAIELVGRRDLESPPEEADVIDRLQAAVTATGGSETLQAWQFPLRQAGLPVDDRLLREGWDRVNDSGGVSRLRRHLTRQIRCWRPEIIVTGCARLKQVDPLGNLVCETLLRAVDDAADPGIYPEHLSELGLTTWQVKKVVAAVAAGENGTVSLATSQLAPRYGRSLAEQAALPRALLLGEVNSPPPVIGFQVLMNRLGPDLGKSDLMQGIRLAPGSDARRVSEAYPEASLETARRAAHKHRNVQAILSRQATHEGAQLNGQLRDLVAGLPNDEGGMVFYQLALAQYRAGRGELAAEAMHDLVERFPQHPLGDAARTWLVAYWASAEIAWHGRQAQQYTFQRTAEYDRQSGGAPPVQQATATVPLQTQETSQVHADAQRSRARRALQWGQMIEQQRPGLYAEPAVRFPLLAAQRREGVTKSGERFLVTLRHAGNANPWRVCAEGERWLEDLQGASPKPFVRCRTTAEKPRLDGRLQEACWQACEPLELRSALRDDGDWPALVLLMRDAEFLYLAGQCGSRTAWEGAAGPRPRDPDLRRHDRVEFLLDTDRDAATYFRLVIDHRGWVAEDCWGDATWNPHWFVAAAKQDQAWSFEAAIPLSDLTDGAVEQNGPWGLGVQRIVPETGFQAWSTPAAVRPRPEGFGYLLWE